MSERNALISVDLNIKAGIACIRDTGIPVTAVVELYDDGYDIAQINEVYPALTIDDVKAAHDHHVNVDKGKLLEGGPFKGTPIIAVEKWSAKHRAAGRRDDL